MFELIANILEYLHVLWSARSLPLFLWPLCHVMTYLVSRMYPPEMRFLPCDSWVSSFSSSREYAVTFACNGLLQEQQPFEGEEAKSRARGIQIRSVGDWNWDPLCSTLPCNRDIKIKRYIWNPIDSFLNHCDIVPICIQGAYVLNVFCEVEQTDSISISYL